MVGYYCLTNWCNAHYVLYRLRFALQINFRLQDFSIKIWIFIHATYHSFFVSLLENFKILLSYNLFPMSYFTIFCTYTSLYKNASLARIRSSATNLLCNEIWNQTCIFNILNSLLFLQTIFNAGMHDASSKSWITKTNFYPFLKTITLKTTTKSSNMEMYESDVCFNITIQLNLL